MLRMHGFATPVKPWGRRWCSFCQKNSEQSTDWELGAHLEAAVTWSWEARSSQATSFSCSEEKVRIFVWALRINCTYLTHLSQDQKSVRRGSKEGRLGDGFSFSWNLSLGDLWNLLHSYSSSPKSQFFCHSCVTFFYVAAIFQRDFFKQFLHLTIKQKFFNPYIGDLFLWKSWFLQTSLQLLILYHLLNSCERFGCSVLTLLKIFLKLLLLFF